MLSAATRRSTSRCPPRARVRSTSGAAVTALDISTTGVSGLYISNTTTGATNTAQINLSRGDVANGYSGVSFLTGGSNNWVLNVPAGTNDLRLWDYGWSNGVGNKELMRFSAASGTIGIGMMGGTSATATLQVSGTFTVSTSAQITTPSLYVSNSGAVGIGTIAPTYQNGYGALSLDGTGGGIVDLYANATRTLRLATTGGANYIQGLTAIPLYFYTNNTARATIDSSGNVGIGTTSPGGLLELHQLSGTYGSGNKFLNYTYAAVNPFYMYMDGNEFPHLVSGAGFDMVFDTNGGSSANQLYLKSGGNVGIGTASPIAQLSLGSNESVIKLATFDDGVAGHLYGIGESGGYLTFGAQITAGGTPQMVLGNSGNVGIGTTTPAYMLDINKSYGSGTDGGYPAIRVGNTYTGGAHSIAKVQVEANNAGVKTLLLSTVSASNAAMVAGAPSTADMGFAGTGTNSPFGIMTNATQRMIVDTSGNVGIGVTSPGSKLDVAGSGQVINASTNGAGGTTNYAVLAQSTGAASNNTGLYANATGATNNYGVRIVNPSSGANNWAIYSDATAQSYFAGNVGTPGFRPKPVDEDAIAHDGCSAFEGASDETSARVCGKTHWQWTFAAATAVFHIIAPTRGKVVPIEFLAGAKPKVWLSDRLAAQGNHAEAHQVCLAHLIRDAQYAMDAGDTVFAPAFKRFLQKACAIGRRRPALADATIKTYARNLQRELDRLLDLEPRQTDGNHLRASMVVDGRDKLLVFMTRRDVEPTNNVSERALRPSVIFRNYAERMVMRSPRREVLPAAVFS